MSELTQVLRHLLPVDDPNALVGPETGDDAAVYRLADDRALVVTADFFTPIVDDAYDFGRIAAANALSDIYAMGARPLFALNLVGFPRRMLGDGILEEIIRGGSTMARAAGIAVLGGHSIDDAEPKYGMVAVGEVHPERMVTVGGARPGDRIVLTKPIGSGVIATAIKAGVAAPEVIEEATQVMCALNVGASRAMLSAGATAATDVTGFGLLGHLRNVLRASGVAAELRASEVPVMTGAVPLAVAGHVPGGTTRNVEDTAGDVDFAAGVDETTRTLLADAQTSGGLLICVPADRVDALLAALEGEAPAAAVIGEIVAGEPGEMRVDP